MQFSGSQKLGSESLLGSLSRPPPKLSFHARKTCAIIRPFWFGKGREPIDDVCGEMKRRQVPVAYDGVVGCEDGTVH